MKDAEWTIVVFRDHVELYTPDEHLDSIAVHLNQEGVTARRDRNHVSARGEWRTVLKPLTEYTGHPDD